MTPPPKIKRGTTTQKWPFFPKLRVGFYYEEADVSKHDALRTAASRTGRHLKRQFKVRKETVTPNGGAAVEVIRVYRMK